MKKVDALMKKVDALMKKVDGWFDYPFHEKAWRLL